MPTRIQRKRTRGWKMPPGAVYVGRPTEYGNPFRIGGFYMRGSGGDRKFAGFIYTETTEQHADARFTHILTAQEAVDWFRWYRETYPPNWLPLLRGKNLACWCKVGQPCHADVLLDLANKVAPVPETPQRRR